MKPSPAEPKPWFKTEYPYGIDTFNYGVSCIAQGPDGFIYVSSGSRTDHGEKGNDPKRSTAGEVELTSCIWRLDPRSESPKIETFARGLRNAWGFCWDDNGRMFATENGPNAKPPEELNLLERGKHYGFPYRFSDWDHKAYPDQPDAPPGLQIELPVVNDGPDGGVSATQPTLSTFDGHSSPAGIVCLGSQFPVRDRGRSAVGRQDVGRVRRMGESESRQVVLCNFGSWKPAAFLRRDAGPRSRHRDAARSIQGFRGVHE